MMRIYTFANGDVVHRYNRSLVAVFQGSRTVLSTSPLNGGYQEGLATVFNHSVQTEHGVEHKLRASTYEDHMRLIAAELGLDPERSAGISTAADMENVAIQEERFEDLTVTALVTGGVEVNGGRVGDPASFHERAGKTEILKPGTINILLMIDADLPSGSLTRALVTCTEAKTAALQELMAGSHYSQGLATGSGTDGTILVANPESPLKLTHAGKHAKLGELIGQAVKKAVKEALYRQTGLSPQKQHSMLRRWERFGVTSEKLWLHFGQTEPESGSQTKTVSKAEFMHVLHEWEQGGLMVVWTSLYIHLLDQLEWGLLSPDEVQEGARKILKELSQHWRTLKVQLGAGTERLHIERQPVDLDDANLAKANLTQTDHAQTEKTSMVSEKSELPRSLVEEFVAAFSGAVAGGMRHV
ncbi:MAG: adenosylcobinamide amidohydrolase [Desulfitobacteriaceae bacterium]